MPVVYIQHVCRHWQKSPLMSAYWQSSTLPPLFEGWIVVEDRQRRQQHAHMMKNGPDHADDKSNHLPVANKADEKQMMSVSPLY